MRMTDKGVQQRLFLSLCYSRQDSITWEQSSGTDVRLSAVDARTHVGLNKHSSFILRYTIVATHIYNKRHVRCFII